jgi:hypothetical protein
MQKDRACYFCGRLDGLEKHHVFGGVANRPISEKYGLIVYLCHRHHTGADGAQYDKEKNLLLKRDAQMAFEMENSRDLWMSLIGKNYLG